MKTKHARVRRGGFSLIELMIVVVITGVLAATAIPTFTEFIYKSRTTEAVSFLGVIKLKQESFRSEFGSYLQCIGGTVITSGTTGSVLSDLSGGTPANFHPDRGSGSASIGWTTDTCFATLAASPDGPVRFRYAWIAGTPALFAGSGITAAMGAVPADHYFVAQGHADLDDDGNWCVYELTSFTRNVWVGTPGGAPLASGWE